jgi:hypothetical protein
MSAVDANRSGVGIRPAIGAARSSCRSSSCRATRSSRRAAKLTWSARASPRDTVSASIDRRHARMRGRRKTLAFKYDADCGAATHRSARQNIAIGKLVVCALQPTGSEGLSGHRTVLDSACGTYCASPETRVACVMLPRTKPRELRRGSPPLREARRRQARSIRLKVTHDPILAHRRRRDRVCPGHAAVRADPSPPSGGVTYYQTNKDASRFQPSRTCASAPAAGAHRHRQSL